MPIQSLDEAQDGGGLGLEHFARNGLVSHGFVPRVP
jgi:hypothetical protein